MLGGMFAGHDESGGETVDRNGRQYKLFYGMSSATAMKRYAGGIAEYRSVITNTHTQWIVQQLQIPDYCYFLLLLLKNILPHISLHCQGF